MNRNLRQYAPAVFWAGAAVFALALLILLSGLTTGSGRGPVPTEVMLGVGVVLMLLSALLNPDTLRRAFGMRSVRYGGNAALFSLAVIGALVVLNYLGVQPRFNWRQDFTTSKQYTLSPQTLQILENLKVPIKAYFFFGPDPATGALPFNLQEFRDRLREYSLRSPNFTYEEADPSLRPDLAQELELTLPTAVVMTTGGKKQQVSGSSESDFTSAINKLLADKPRVVYFLTGHKERDLASFEATGYATARAFLERDNYTVDTFSFQVTTTVPVSASVLVLAGPGTAYSEDETKALETYLNGGGRLLAMLDPRQPNSFSALLAKWGIELRDDVVVEPQQFHPNLGPLYPLVNRYPSSPITAKFSGQFSMLPASRSLKRVDNFSGTADVRSVIQSTDQAWGEKNLDLGQGTRYDDGVDTKGPLDFAMSAEGNAPEAPALPAGAVRKTRLVVFGTSDLASNRSLQVQGIVNGDLFANAINWLAEEESLISIRATPADQRVLTMTAQQQNLAALLVICLLPGLVGLTGASIWWRRR